MRIELYHKPRAGVLYLVIPEDRVAIRVGGREGEGFLEDCRTYGVFWTAHDMKADAWPIHPCMGQNAIEWAEEYGRLVQATAEEGVNDRSAMPPELARELAKERPDLLFLSAVDPKEMVHVATFVKSPGRVILHAPWASIADGDGLLQRYMRSVASGSDGTPLVVTPNVPPTVPADQDEEFLRWVGSAFGGKLEYLRQLWLAGTTEGLHMVIFGPSGRRLIDADDEAYAPSPESIIERARR